MTRVRTIVLIALSAFALALPAAASADTSTSMVGKINSIRHAHGLRSVREVGTLMNSAHAYADHMMASHYFGHASRIHASSRFRTLGEIIEIHRGGSPAVAFTANDWMNSAEHRAIILDPEFTYAGAGYTIGNFGGRKQTIWVMHFGRR